METLGSDFMQSMKPMRESYAPTIEEVIGVNVDSPFGNMMQITCSQDKNHISVGGTPDLGPNTQFSVRFPESQSVHDILSMMIVGNVNLKTQANAASGAYFILNALTLFKGLAVKIGQQQMSYANQDVYQQAFMYSLPKAVLRPYARGLFLDLNDYDEWFDGGGAASAATQPGAVQATQRGYANIIDMQTYANRLRLDSTKVGGYDNVFAVPLWLIFPQLLHMDGESLYTGLGQSIECIIQTQAAQACVFNTLGTDAGPLGSFVITNISLIRQYSYLSAAIQERLLRSEIIMHPMSQYQYINQPLASNNNLNFSISRGMKMKRLVWVFAPTTAGQGNGSGGGANPRNVLTTFANIMTTQAPAGAGTGPNYIWSPIALFPNFPISIVEIDAAGDRVIFNSTQLSCLHQISGTQHDHAFGHFDIGLDGGLYTGFIGDLRKVFSIDLTRFPCDQIGSTAKGQVQVQVKITLNTSGPAYDGQFALSNPGLVYATDTLTSGSNLSNILSSMGLYAFIEFTEDLSLKQGIYQ